MRLPVPGFSPAGLGRAPRPASPTERLRPFERPAGPIAREPVRLRPAPRRVERAPEPQPPNPQRELARTLFLAPDGDGPQVVLFAAVDRHGFASDICVRVADALVAETSAGVCIVDADLRQPSIGRRLGPDTGRGLADVLRGGGAAHDAALQAGDNLWVVRAGPASANPAGLFGAERVRAVVGDLRASFDYVLLHAPPLAVCPESTVLSSLADGVVLVIEAHRTRRHAAQDVKHRLESAGVPLLGAVLASRQVSIRERLNGWL